MLCKPYNAVLESASKLSLKGTLFPIMKVKVNKLFAHKNVTTQTTDLKYPYPGVKDYELEFLDFS